MFIDTTTTKKLWKLTFGKDYFHPRRIGFYALAFVPYTSVWIFDAIGRALDEQLFPEYRDVDIGQPIFIMASPRSGTTLLHRLMSLDQQFTSYSLWQTLLPTLTAYKTVDALGKIDARLGRPLDRLQDAAARYFFRGWDGIHTTRFNEAEEDEGIFALHMASPSVWLAWPFVDELPRVGYIDQLEIREKFSKFYRGTIQRHMWHEQQQGHDKILLLKNVFNAGRLGVITDAAPDARFINIVRHPYRTIGSLMSFFTVPWRYHSPDIEIDGPQAQAFAKIAMDYALTTHRFMKNLPEERGITIRYEDLIENPEREILKIYERFGLQASEEFRDTLHQAVTDHRRYASKHQYKLQDFGLSEEQVYEQLKEIFDDYDLPRNPADGDAL